MYYIKEVSRNVEGTRASTALIENLIVASSQPRRYESHIARLLLLSAQRGPTIECETPASS
jgi:hypothetical protein